MGLHREARSRLVGLAGVAVLVWFILGGGRWHFVVPLLLLGLLTVRALRWWSGLRRRNALRAAGLDQIDTMSGIEFEQYVAAVLQGVGYRALKYTKTTGDFGVDLIATKGKGKIAVQCKRQ